MLFILNTLDFCIQLMLNPCQVILCIQCPGSACLFHLCSYYELYQGILKGKYHCTVDLLFDWFGLVCFANKNKNVSCHTANSKPVKQEVNGMVILPPLLLFPGSIQPFAQQFRPLYYFTNYICKKVYKIRPLTRTIPLKRLISWRK